MEIKKLIIIRGPSGVGKSAVVKELLQHLDENYAYIPVAQTTYSLLVKEPMFPSDELIDLMQDNIDSLANNFLANGYNVITDAIFYHKTKNVSRLQTLINIGQKNNAKILVFDLVANLDTLLERAKKRGRNKDIKTDFDLIKKKYEKFEKNRYENAVTISTNNKSIKQIAIEVINKIKIN